MTIVTMTTEGQYSKERFSIVNDKIVIRQFRYMTLRATSES